MIRTLIVFMVVFSIIILFIRFYIHKVTDRILTEPFQDDACINDGHFPEKWVVQINQHLARKWKNPSRADVSGTELAIKKLNKLIIFFEKSQFFETEDARATMVAQFSDIRQRWSIMTWEELEKGANGKMHNPN